LSQRVNLLKPQLLVVLEIQPVGNLLRFILSRTPATALSIIQGVQHVIYPLGATLGNSRLLFVFQIKHLIQIGELERMAISGHAFSECQASTACGLRPTYEHFQTPFTTLIGDL